jgi:hypothetical protein
VLLLELQRESYKMVGRLYKRARFTNLAGGLETGK